MNAYLNSKKNELYPIKQSEINPHLKHGEWRVIIAGENKGRTVCFCGEFADDWKPKSKQPEVNPHIKHKEWTPFSSGKNKGRVKCSCGKWLDELEFIKINKKDIRANYKIDIKKGSLSINCKHGVIGELTKMCEFCHPELYMKKPLYVISSKKFKSVNDAIVQMVKWDQKGTLNEDAHIYEVVEVIKLHQPKESKIEKWYFSLFDTDRDTYFRIKELLELKSKEWGRKHKLDMVLQQLKLWEEWKEEFTTLI